MSDDPAFTGFMVMVIMFLALAYFSIAAVLKNIDLKLAIDDMMTLYDIWKNSREKPLWELEKKYLTKEEQKRESVFVKGCSDNNFIMGMEALRKELKL